MADVLPNRISSLHRRHLSLGAEMVVEGSWQRPAHYTSTQEELARVRSASGLCDISPIGKFLVQGDAIEALLKAALSCTDVPTFGRVTPHATSQLLCRLAFDQLLLLTPPEAVDSTRSVLEGASQDNCAHVVDMSSGLTGLCLVGPRSQDVLSKLTDLDLSLPTNANMSCTQTSLSGVQTMLVRVDFGDTPGYRIFVSRDLGEHAWDILTQAGSSEGLTPFGSEALRLLRGEG